MKGIIRSTFLIVTVAAVAFASSPQTPTTPPSTTTPPAEEAPAPAPATGAINILKPSAGEKIRQTTVTVNYALANAGASAAGSPNYRLRLDAQDPVTTTATEYTFSGLTPGAHTITVQLVDANGTPVQGAQAAVQFSVLKQTSMKYGPQAIAAALRLDPATDIRIQDQSRPEPIAHSGALPLLSVIGFGVLLGGLASAMKTKH